MNSNKTRQATFHSKWKQTNDIGFKSYYDDMGYVLSREPGTIDRNGGHCERPAGGRSSFYIPATVIEGYYCKQ